MTLWRVVYVQKVNCKKSFEKIIMDDTDGISGTDLKFVGSHRRLSRFLFMRIEHYMTQNLINRQAIVESLSSQIIYA